MASGDQSTAKIRVALAITELEVGGAERCLVSLAKGLKGGRFEPAVYSLAPRPQPGRDGLVQELEDGQIPAHFIGVRSKTQFWSAVRGLRNHLRRQSPHLLQSFLFHANVTSCLAGKLAGVPIIVTGVRVADPSRCRHFLERRFANRAEKIVCVSDSVQEFCRVEAGLPPEKLIAISNGIDVRQYPAQSVEDLAQFGIPASASVVGYVGRLDVQKGLDWLLDVAPKILDQLDHFHFLFVGDGPLRSRLVEQARRLGIEGRVHFAGWRADVPRILAACSLIVLPSRWEGMPNILLEAMASNRPVVASRAHGVTEILGPSAAEQCVDFGDSDALLAMVVRICQDKQLAARLGQDNRNRVADHFSLAKMLSAYVTLYDSLLALKTGPKKSG